MVRVELVGIRAHTSQMTGVGVGRSLATKVHIRDATLTTKFTMQKKATNYHNINVNRQERKQRAALGNPAPNGLSKSAYVKSTRAAWSIRHPHQPPIQQDKYPRTYKAPISFRAHSLSPPRKTAALMGTVQLVQDHI